MVNTSTPRTTTGSMRAVHALGHPNSPAPRTKWSHTGRGQSGEPDEPAKVTTPSPPAANPPNTPAAPLLTQGAGGDLTVTWTAPAIDGAHDAATSFNLRWSPTGAGTWTVVAGVVSPYDLSGLTAGAAYDVEIQADNDTGPSGWSATSTLTTASGGGANAPNAPAIAGVTAPADGTASKLAVTWTAPAVDGTHDAATGYNLRYSPAGAGSWTTVTGVTSPCTLTGLAGASAYDVEVQGTNTAPGPGAWSATTTATTWGATVAPGVWTAASTQTHGAAVAPNGGVQMVLVAAPTAIGGGAFAWTMDDATVPTSGLIAAASDGQTNGWAQYFDAPATAGTYYLWMLARDGGGATIGALVTSAITVS
jgi:Fibronectin type III domain